MKNSENIQKGKISEANRYEGMLVASNVYVVFQKKTNPNPTMNEQDFWLELRSKISKVKIENGFNWIDTNVYCDWIEPQEYILSKPFGTIKGRIGFLMPKMEEFRFILNFPNHCDLLSEMDWRGLAEATFDTENLYISGGIIELNVSKSLL